MNPRYGIPITSIAEVYGLRLVCYAEKKDQLAVLVLATYVNAKSWPDPKMKDPLNDVLFRFLPDPRTVDPLALKRDCTDRSVEAFFNCPYGLPESWALMRNIILSRPNPDDTLFAQMIAAHNLASAGGEDLGYGSVIEARIEARNAGGRK